MNDLNFTNQRQIKPSDLLDIRHLTDTGEDLKGEILRMVSATQSPLLIMPLPNILIMTRAQYDAMQTDPDMIGDYQYSSERVYVTPLNAMDVRIVE